MKAHTKSYTQGDKQAVGNHFFTFDCLLSTNNILNPIHSMNPLEIQNTN